MASDPPPHDLPSGTTSPPAAGKPLPAHVLPTGLAWAAVVAIGGGMICGILIVKFGTLGNVGLMVVGVLGGAVSRRISQQAVPWLGWALVAAMCLAMVVAQLWWIKAVGWQNAATWLEAIRIWPQMFQKAEVDLIAGAVCAGLGAHSAYWRAGKRFRRVLIME